MFSLHLSTQNVNSLVRTRSFPGQESKQYFSPFLNLMKKSTEILLLSDTRLDANKLKFLENQFSFTEIIGVRRQRIFATSSEHCNRTGGVAIFVPQSYDDILSICHCEHDPSQIPRFLTILAKLQGHCKVFLSVVYGSPKSNLDSLSQTHWKPHKQIRWLPSHSSRGHQWKTRWLFWLLRNLHNKQHSLWQNNELPWIGRPLRCSWEKPLKKW